MAPSQTPNCSLEAQTCALDMTVTGFANGWPVERDCRGGECFVFSQQGVLRKPHAAFSLLQPPSGLAI
jgi:hypothetical protein